MRAGEVPPGGDAWRARSSVQSWFERDGLIPTISNAACSLRTNPEYSILTRSYWRPGALQLRNQHARSLQM